MSLPVGQSRGRLPTVVDSDGSDESDGFFNQPAAQPWSPNHGSHSSGGDKSDGFSLYTINKKTSHFRHRPFVAFLITFVTTNGIFQKRRDFDGTIGPIVISQIASFEAMFRLVSPSKEQDR
jgi:hypothetical protein